jgi:hypothetical protein
MYNYLYSFGLMMSKGTGHNLGRGPSKLGPIWHFWSVYNFQVDLDRPEGSYSLIDVDR